MLPLAEEAGMRRVLVVVAAVVAVVAVVVGFRWYLGRQEPAPPPPVPTPAPAPTPVPSWVDGLTPDTADSAIRTAAAGLSGEAEWATWLGESDLVRRFVAAVALVAEGKSPRSQLAFLRPRGRFRAVERGGALVADPASYRRYEAVVRVVTSIDPVRAAALLGEAMPLLEEAYREIAPPGVPFRDTLLRALDHLLAVPVPDGPVRLEERTVTTYRYADPGLETLSDAQKQLLRLGPSGGRRIQDWLAAFRSALVGEPGAASEGEPLHGDG